MPSPSLALCVIARDEEARLGACLDSARPFVDEVVVVDTGSRDRTPEVARAHGARVAAFAWCDDFAAARNAAIEAATADWVLMLDADEELDPASGPRLRPILAAAPAGLHCFLPRIDSIIRPEAPDGYLTSHHSRLFPRRPDVRFVGAIHEEIKYLPDPARTVVAPVDAIRITHVGYVPAYYHARGKDERNSRILAASLARRPDDPALHFHLGLQHSAMDRHVEAAAALRRCIDLAPRGRAWYLVDAYARLVNALIVLDDDAGLADVVREGEAANLVSRKAHEVLGRHAAAKGRLGVAERHLLRALAPECPDSLTVYPGAGRWSTRLALGRVYEQMGEPRRALEQAERALEDDDLPGRARVLVDASRLAHGLGDGRRSADWLRLAMAAASADDLEDQQALLRLSLALLADPALDARTLGLPAMDGLLAREDWQAAYEAALALAPVGTPEVARLLYLAERLLEGGAADAALDVLARALDEHAENARVYWLLTRTLAALGRFDDALAAVDVLRGLPGGAALAAAA